MVEAVHYIREQIPLLNVSEDFSSSYSSSVSDSSIYTSSDSSYSSSDYSAKSEQISSLNVPKTVDQVNFQS